MPTRSPRTISSEAERATPQPHRKCAKHPTLTVDRTEVCQVDAAQLPPDARFKGDQHVLVQDIRLSTETIRFRKAKWYAPSTGQTYLAPLPAGYDGQFGPNVKALVYTLAFESGLSEPKIHALLRLTGLQISSGQVARMLQAVGTHLESERIAILAAGLRSSPWQHIDVTGTRVAGANHQCHILTDPLYTVYTTTPQRTRLCVLDVLRGGTPRQFWLDQTTEQLMRLMDVPKHARQAVIQQLPREQVITEAAMDAFLAALPRAKSRFARKTIKDACAIAADHAQRDPPLPIVHLLIGDDAPQWAMLTEEMALCWVHDGRAYKRLEPRVEHHRELRDTFLTAYWALYHELRQFQAAPTPAEADRLRGAFRTLVATKTGYAALDARIQITGEKRRGLLMVLEHPEIPLHNNPAELGARRRVRKRDVSFGIQTHAGALRWDCGQTLAATTQQLGVNFYHYVRDRLGERRQPALATLIDERAATMALGRSWEGRPERPDWKPTPVHMWHG